MIIIVIDQNPIEMGYTANLGQNDEIFILVGINLQILKRLKKIKIKHKWNKIKPLTRLLYDYI